MGDERRVDPDYYLAHSLLINYQPEGHLTRLQQSPKKMNVKYISKSINPNMNDNYNETARRKNIISTDLLTSFEKF